MCANVEEAPVRWRRNPYVPRFSLETPALFLVISRAIPDHLALSRAFSRRRSARIIFRMLNEAAAIANTEMASADEFLPVGYTCTHAYTHC